MEKKIILRPDEFPPSLLDLQDPLYCLSNGDVTGSIPRIAKILEEMNEETEALFEATAGIDLEDRDGTPPEVIYLRLTRTPRGYTCERIRLEKVKEGELFRLEGLGK